MVSIFLNGVLVERELIAPRLDDPFHTGAKQLYYSYQNNRGLGFIPHEQVQVTGQGWSWTLWNPETGEYQELEQDPDTASGLTAN